MNFANAVCNKPAKKKPAIKPVVQGSKKDPVLAKMVLKNRNKSIVSVHDKVGRQKKSITSLSASNLEMASVKHSTVGVPPKPQTYFTPEKHD